MILDLDLLAFFSLLGLKKMELIKNYSDLWDETMLKYSGNLIYFLFFIL